MPSMCLTLVLSLSLVLCCTSWQPYSSGGGLSNWKADTCFSNFLSEVKAKVNCHSPPTTLHQESFLFFTSVLPSIYPHEGKQNTLLLRVKMGNFEQTLGVISQICKSAYPPNKQFNFFLHNYFPICANKIQVFFSVFPKVFKNIGP